MTAPSYSLRIKTLVFSGVAAITLATAYDLLLPPSDDIEDPPFQESASENPCEDRAPLGQIGADELEAILQKHQDWLRIKDAEGTVVAGKRAILCHADLSKHADLLLKFDLRKAVLIGANLEGAQLANKKAEKKERRFARLEEADLRGANLRNALLERAKMNGVVLNDADLQAANLRRAEINGKAELYRTVLAKADLWRAELRNAHLDHANLRGADLTRAITEDANFFTADLTGACLYRTQFRNARLKYAKFRDAIFWETELEGARMSRALLTGAVFEAASLPDAKTLSDAVGLQHLTSATRRVGGLAALRAGLAGSGLRTSERQVAFALERERTRNLFEPYRLPKKRREDFDCDIPEIEDSSGSAWFEGAFRFVMFELVFGYGLYYQRPLELLWLSILVFALVYHYYLWREPDLNAALAIENGPETIEEAESSATTPPNAAKGDLVYAKDSRLDYVRYKERMSDALVFALYFSFVSTLHFGVQWLDFGRWIARLQKRAYSIFGVGLLRSLSGLQSILGLLFLTLFVLSYFGRPLH